MRLPPSPHWSTAARPGGFDHITLEEADATCWAVEAKLRRPGGLFTRSGLGGDNAASVGAFREGRSSSRRVNGRCRRRAAAEFPGGLGIFDFWISTEVSPADELSRRHLLPTQAAKASQPPPCREIYVQDTSDDQVTMFSPEVVVLRAPPGAWAQSGLFFLHISSGPRYDGDLCHEVESQALEAGYLV